jgi:tetratricopeptide (TPR) repeat protein
LAAVLCLAANPKLDDAKAKLKAGKYEDAIALLEAEHKQSPKNEDVRKTLSGAHTDFGGSLMNNAELPPFRKYPAALKEFRRAVEIDPENRKAKDSIAVIEGIYKSMGRPVPK